LRGSGNDRPRRRGLTKVTLAKGASRATFAGIKRRAAIIETRPTRRGERQATKRALRKGEEDGGVP
jgi:hypothetical protein